MAVVADGLTVGGVTIAFATLRADAARAPRFVVHRLDAPDWRLVFAAAPLGLPPLIPLGRPGRTTVATSALAGTAAVAIGVALWLFGGGWLDALAPLVPQATLAPIGRGLAVEIGGAACTAPTGRAALDRLVARLTPPHFAVPVAVRVSDLPLVNAVARPGGEIVVFRGLIDKAASGDEVAGVVAHELAHAAHRDPTRALLRQVGVSLLIQSIGGSTGGIADLALVLDGSRATERAADAGALKLLARAHISPAGLLAFFRRMHADAGMRSGAMPESIARFAASHPGDAERIAMITAAPTGPTTPALTPDDWQALRTICATHRDGDSADAQP